MNNRILHLLFCCGFVFCFLFCKVKPKPLEKEEADPRPTSFWYYNNEFSLDTTMTSLRTDGVYFRIVGEDNFGDTYEIFRFYEDGLVLEYSIYASPNEVLALEKIKEGNIHGYYKTVTDSLFFTTKVYYDHDPTFYVGKIFTDSMVLNSVNYKKKEEKNFTYYFLKE